MTLLDTLKMKNYPDDYARAGLNIIYTGNWLQEYMTNTLKPYGISEQQFNVLRILKGQKGNPINLLDIQERMLHKSSNTTRLVEKLRIKELVERTTCPTNRRKVEITITKKGMKLLEELNPVLAEQGKELFKNITQEEAHLIGELLEKLRGES